MEYTGIVIEQLANGKWRLTDLSDGNTRDYRTEEMARKIAATISAENDEA